MDRLKAELDAERACVLSVRRVCVRTHGIA
jgi:hypothetical protein